MNSRLSIDVFIERRVIPLSEHHKYEYVPMYSYLFCAARTVTSRRGLSGRLLLCMMPINVVNGYARRLHCI